VATHPRDIHVQSTGVRLAVREHSAWEPGKESLVLVHGYPDQQDTWAALVAALPLDDLHVVTYDVRGSGGSDAPAHVQDYRTGLLVDDLVAVLDAVLPEHGSAHLVGHDWGSVQLWDAVAAEATDPRLSGRIASFTSISGPSLDHMAWLSRHPRGRKVALLQQLAHSWYVCAFQVPVLPDLLWSRGHQRLGRLISARQGLPAQHWGDELGRNAKHGLNLYRANVLRGPRRTGPVRTDVPVLVIHPTRDAFLTRVITEDLTVGCSDVRVVEVDAGHWVISTHADRVADLVTDHVGKHRS
jgi:pimeloyl-ACP methyl ester carboxylesterase